MKKALITGSSGFVGPYLKRELELHGYSVVGMDLKDAEYIADITNYAQVLSVIDSVKPDYIFHLAGFSSVAKSFEQPELCKKINVIGTKNLLEAVLSIGIKPHILVISSSDVYGNPQYNPVDEKHPLQLLSPYAESRVNQEELALQYSLPIIIARSFSHTGKGQHDSFVIPSFKKQVNDATDGGVINVGNLDVIRDISDVTDVVKAYTILIEKGIDKEIYNVGSGFGYKLHDVLDLIIKESGKKLTIHIDPSRLRKKEIMNMTCDNSKITQLGASFKKIFLDL